MIKINEEYNIKCFKDMKKYLDYLINYCKDKKLKDIFTTCALGWGKKDYTNKRYDVDEPLYIVFKDNTVIKIEYYWYADIYIQITTMDKLTEKERQHYNEYHIMDINVNNRMIKEYELESFSEEFEINPATGETRLVGGDYFKNIIFYLDNNIKLYITPEDPINDGYCDIWLESNSEKGVYRY